MPERGEPVEQALRALGVRDRTTEELDDWLERRGVDPAERAEALETLGRLGYLDDGRFACARARELAGRGSGDELIRHDLERRGVASELIEAALDELEPERERAQRLVDRRGATAKTARYLASRGFGQDALEGIVAQGR
jgi:regulatory protein